MPATARKPLDAQFVGKINTDAMKALSDNRARDLWGKKGSGSPLTTNMLCAEIARLNLAMENALDYLAEVEREGAIHENNAARIRALLVMCKSEDATLAK